MPLSVKQRVGKTKELFENIPPEQITQHTERLSLVLEGITDVQKIQGYTTNYYAVVSCILACKDKREKTVEEMVDTINAFDISFKSEKGKEVVLFTWLTNTKENDTILRLEIPKKKYEKLDRLHADILHFVWHENPRYSGNSEGKFYYIGNIAARTLSCEEEVKQISNGAMYSVFPFTKNNETLTPIAPVLCFQQDEEDLPLS